jgi:hypothetical protein
MNNELFESEDVFLIQVSKDANTIVDLESAKAFAEKYDSFAQSYIQRHKILRESTGNNQHPDYSKYTLEELKEITQKNTSKHLLEALIMTNINDYRVTVGLPILKKHKLMEKDYVLI